MAKAVKSGRVTPKQRQTRVSSDQVVSFLCGRGITLIQERFGLNCCVPSGRIAVAALKQFGIIATCMPVKLEVRRGNAAFWVHGKGTLTYNDGLVTGWDGHLIVIIAGRDGNELLDLSLEQANRLDRGIRLQPLWADLSPEFWTIGLTGHLVNGSAVVYERIYDNGWHKMPKTDHQQPLVEQIVREIRAQALSPRL